MMRIEKNYDQVIDRLWMGGIGVIHDPFDFVLTLSLTTHLSDPWQGAGEQWFFEDNWSEFPDLQELSLVVADLVVRYDSGQKLLIRCQGGYNRSGLVVASTLIELGYTPEQAVDLVRDARGKFALYNTLFHGWILGRTTSNE